MKRLNNLFFTVFSLSVMGSFLIICVILLNKIFRINYSRRWLYIIWAVITIRLIIPVNIGIIDIPKIANSNGIIASNSMKHANTIKELNDIKPSNTISADNKQITADINDIEDNMDSSDVAIRGEALKVNNLVKNVSLFFPVWNVVTVIWVVGTILFLIYHLGAYFSYRKKIYRWGVFVKSNEALEVFQNLCIELKLKRQINLMKCSQVQAPMLIGFIKPSIVLPSQDFTSEQYYFILKHELIHYKHHDLFYKLMLLCATALHWFNPFIHYMAYLANNDIELYCDEKIVAKKDLHYRESYSKILLQIITGETKNNNLLLSTGFGSKNRRLKNRFFQIMNSKPTKKGTCIVLGLACLIIVTGNLMVCFIPAKTSKAESSDMQISPSFSASENEKNNASDKIDRISNVLVVGIVGMNNNEYSHTDSILVVSMNPVTKKICLTSFLRDMYLQIPEHGKGKLNSAYELGGAKLIKNTIESNFDITIDHTVVVNMKVFANIINSIGGVEMELTEKEAEYLNHTNYISNKKYRNVKAGKQRLNGNQALGYIRVRKVSTDQGESGDLGRTTRLRSLLSNVIEECSKKDISELTKVLVNVVPNVFTDLSLKQILIYINTVLQGNLKIDTFSIPANGSYTTKVQDCMSIIDVDLDENIKVLKQIYN